jgi:acyl carrier protein
MPTQLSNEVDEIVAERLRIDEDEFDDESQFEDDIGAESLDLVELAEAVEAELGVHVPDDDLADLETVGAVKEYVAAESA